MIVASSYPPFDPFDCGCPFWTALQVESGVFCSLLMSSTIVSSFQNRPEIFAFALVITFKPLHLPKFFRFSQTALLLKVNQT